ncbi:MAG TPA: TIGR03560 family F420-dependent LLM class oxidoreductase [Dehalococcoidia bacterium]|nr:TIGR03560 family F420-dependent LLM class oxidoreductase [Dehalococcoidia bacterium]
MKLGVMIEGQEGLNWERWRHITSLVEELGFESQWRSDHLFPFGEEKARDSLEAWSSLVELAARGARLTFGTLVSSMTFRHPSMLARQAAAVDALAPGRLVLGVGAGWNVGEHEAFGIALPPMRERMDRLEEGIRVIKALLTGDKVSCEGKYYSLKDAQMRPAPPPGRVRLLIGGGGEQRTLRMVARYADEWNMGGGNPDFYRQKLAVLERHCAAVKRDPSTIARSLMLSYVIGRNEAEVAQKVETARRTNPRLASVAPEEAAARMRAFGALVGTPPAIVAQLKIWESLGVSRVMLHHLNQTDDDSLRLIAAEVLPQVA